MIRNLILALLLALSISWGAARNGASVIVQTASNSGSTSVTVPVGTTFALLQWTGFNGSAVTMTSMSLGGVGGTEIIQTGGTGSSNGAGAFGVENPTIGSVTLAWDFSGTDNFTVGAQLVVSFFNAVQLGNVVRDFGAGSVDATATISDNLSSAADDFAHILVVSYDASANTGITGQTTDQEDGPYQTNHVDIAHVNSPGASSTTMEAQSVQYGSAIFVTLRNAVAAGSSGGRGTLLGVGK